MAFFIGKLSTSLASIHGMLKSRKYAIMATASKDNTVECTGFLFSSFKQQGNCAVIRTQVFGSKHTSQLHSANMIVCQNVHLF